MSMSHEASARDAIPVGDLIALVDALTLVVGAENTELERGTPASLSSTLAAKARLGLALEAHVKRVRAGVPLDDGDVPERRAELGARSRQLEALMDENRARLRQAMTATRLRINAVMRALREHETRASAYSKDGAAQARPVCGPRGRLV